jgi:hypothetical protein
MAFQQENMGVLSYCNGFTVWYYRSETDNLTKIVSSGYFTPFYEALSKEDVIFFNESQGRTGRRRINQLTPSLVTITHLL